MRSNIHIIAEAGSNNNGNLQKAKNLVDIAQRAGANSVKFQMINTWGLYLPGKYDYGHYNIDDVIKIRQEGEMSDQEYAELHQHAISKGIAFSSSVFDEKALKLLASLSPPYIKIASCDLNNVSFLSKVASYGIKTVISTGMSTLSDVELAVETLTTNGLNDIVLLHCVSVYPAKMAQTNLRFIEVLKKSFGLPVGFSDHTGTSHAACIAVALGATWFEKHFTEDKTQKGLDHAYAMEEEGLRDYVRDIHDAYEALTLKEVKISDAERYTRRRARRSLYAATNLPAGHVVSEENVLCVRPENIMQADEYYSIIGRKLARSVTQYQPFSPEFFE